MKWMLEKRTWGELVSLLLYGILSHLFYWRTNNPITVGLAWNLLLAWIPLLCIRMCKESHTRIKPFFGVLWLLFLPNAFYFITDLIHVPAKMEWLTEKEVGKIVVEHSTSLMEWSLLILIGAGTFLALHFGLLALHDFYEEISLRLTSLWGWGVVAVVSLLCGVGIYIGRFLRFNSWDILHPFSLLRKLIQNIDLFSIGIVILFGVTIFLLFLFYRTTSTKTTKQK